MSRNLEPRQLFRYLFVALIVITLKGKSRKSKYDFNLSASKHAELKNTYWIDDKSTDRPNWNPNFTPPPYR